MDSILADTMTESVALEWTVLVVVAISVVHLLAPYFHDRIQR